MFARDDHVQTAVNEMDRFHDAASLLRSHPDYKVATSVREHLRDVLASGRLKILDDTRN
jgi:hypothetical protein